MQSNTALLIIDVQAAMFVENDPVYQGEALLTKLVKLIYGARVAGVPVIYIQHCSNADDDLKIGSPGWAIHTTIAPLSDDLIVQKHHPDSFQDTILQSELERRNIIQLILAGIQTEYCVDTTCRRAYSLGYNVVLVQDAHSTWNSNALQAQQIIDHHNLVLGDWFAKLKSTIEIDFSHITP